MAPYLWALLSLSILRRMQGMIPVAAHIPFADDILVQWRFRDEAGLRAIPAQMSDLFRLLQAYKLQVCAAKTGVLRSWWGTRTHQIAKTFTARVRGQRFFTIHPGPDETVQLPIVDSHPYLGIILSYKNFEMQSLRYRLRQTWVAFNRLSHTLRNRRLQTSLRLQLRSSVCLATACYGLLSTGLSKEGREKFQSVIIKQLRMIIGDHSFLTGHKHDEVLSRHKVEDPLARLDRLPRSAFTKLVRMGISSTPMHLQGGGSNCWTAWRRLSQRSHNSCTECAETTSPM